MSSAPIASGCHENSAVEPAQVVALAPFHQALGQVGRHVEGVMPALAALREVRPDPRDGDVHDGERAHGARVQARKGERGRAAPIVAHEVEAVDAQMALHQLGHVLGNGAAVVAVERAAGVP
jgi:hypothetical protein